MLNELSGSECNKWTWQLSAGFHQLELHELNRFVVSQKWVWDNRVYNSDTGYDLLYRNFTHLYANVVDGKIIYTIYLDVESNNVPF